MSETKVETKRVKRDGWRVKERCSNDDPIWFTCHESCRGTRREAIYAYNEYYSTLDYATERRKGLARVVPVFEEVT